MKAVYLGAIYPCKAFKFKAPSDWNTLPVRTISLFCLFKNALLPRLKNNMSVLVVVVFSGFSLWLLLWIPLSNFNGLSLVLYCAVGCIWRVWLLCYICAVCTVLYMPLYCAVSHSTCVYCVCVVLYCVVPCNITVMLCHGSWMCVVDGGVFGVLSGYVYESLYMCMFVVVTICCMYFVFYVGPPQKHNSSSSQGATCKEISKVQMVIQLPRDSIDLGKWEFADTFIWVLIIITIFTC